jgi:hypothetical protein
MFTKNLVLLSYGNTSEYQRGVFCILSFFAWCENCELHTRIVLYTDNPDFFRQFLANLQIKYVYLNDAALEEMSGQHRFSHRIKIAVINETFQNYPNEDILFIDTDTFFYTKPTFLLNHFVEGKCYMHKQEYTLKESVNIFASYNQPEFPLAFLNFIHGRKFLVGGVEQMFGPDHCSWNSGVLGLDKNFATYIPDVFNITDAFYVNSKWFVSEQLAFSLVLQSISEINPTDEFIFHYWGKRQKTLMDNLINKFLKHYTEKPPENELIREITLNWRKVILRDMLIEQAVGALQSYSWYFGFKKIVQLTLTGPKSLYLLSRELLKAGKN